MVKYWVRILGAWALLKVASSLMNDAQELVNETTKSLLEHKAAQGKVEVVEDAEVVA